MSARTTCTSSRSISAIVPSAALASRTQLSMAANKKKKSKARKKPSSGGGGGVGGLKGFGSSVATKDSSTAGGAGGGGGGTIDRSRDALAFYDYLERHGAGDNLKRVALATFPLPGIKGSADGQDIRIRGVMATRQIKKGEPIIDVPYELAMNLGRESSDPTLPAVALLQDYCRWRSASSGSEGRSTGSSSGGKREDGGNDRDDRGAYFPMLPPYRGDDCRGSTDFFSDAALEALQFPPIQDETVRRREQTAARYERDVEPMTQISDNLYRWTDGGGDGGGDSDSKADSEVVTEEHLRWAVWLVTSRVLTVQGEEGTGEAYRLMIPLIDMCNHDRGSVHVLTGRAVPGGRLKIFAGETVEAGSQVNIPYGGGVAGNDRFIQDYGFLDAADGGFAFDVVARALLGGGGEFGRTLMGQRDRTAALEALKTTTIEQDETELEGTTERDMREALAFRIGVKRALERLDDA